MKKLSIILFCLLLSSSLIAQDFEGIIVYKITYSDLPSEMKGAEATMPDSQTFYIKKSKSKFEIVMPMGTTVIYNDSEKHISTVLMNTMGQNFKMTLSSDELDDIDSVKGGTYNVSYMNEEKIIAGYVCKKAVVVSEERKQSMEIYYTDKIQSMAIKGLEGLNIDGMPLEYIVKTEDMSMTVIVEKIEQKIIDDDIFIIPEGYIEMPENIKALMKSQ